MLYELHITVDSTGNYTCRPLRWSDHCENNDSKPLLIELQPQGTVQMMNATRFEGAAEEADEWVRECLEFAEPFTVVRSKLEVPLDQGVGVAFREVCYHECHVKILCDPERAKWATDIAASFGWVVSRNLYLPRVAGMEKWYLTQRRYPSDGLSALEAAADFHAAWSVIAPNMPPAARMEMETVIADTNPGLDAGWA